MSWLKGIRRWFQRFSAAEDRAPQFEFSARRLIAACRSCGDSTEDFMQFLSSFLSELTGMRHTLDHLKHLPLSSVDWSENETLKDQLPAIEAAMISVTGQIQARIHLLTHNLQALDNLDQALKKVKGQMDEAVLNALSQETEALIQRIHQQNLSIQSLNGLIHEEQKIYQTVFHDFSYSQKTNEYQ